MSGIVLDCYGTNVGQPHTCSLAYHMGYIGSVKLTHTCMYTHTHTHTHTHKRTDAHTQTHTAAKGHL